MALAAHNFTIQDDAGNIVTDVDIEVRLDTVGQPLVQLYSDRDGLSAIGNPFTSASGTGRFHVAGGAYQIRAFKSGFEAIQRHVGIGTASEFDADAFETGGGGSPATDVSAEILAALASVPRFESQSAAAAEDLSAHDRIYVEGYASLRDGGHGYWRKVSTSPVGHNGFFQDAAGDVWEPDEEIVNTKMIGMALDDSTNDRTVWNTVIGMLNSGIYKTFYVPEGISRVSGASLDAITASDWEIRGAHQQLTIIKKTGTTNANVFVIGDSSNIARSFHINHIGFDNGLLSGADSTITGASIDLRNTSRNWKINNIKIDRCADGIITGNTTDETDARQGVMDSIRIDLVAASGSHAAFNDVGSSNIFLSNSFVTISGGGTNTNTRGIWMHPGENNNGDTWKVENVEINLTNATCGFALDIVATSHLVGNRQFTNCVFDRAETASVRLVIGAGPGGSPPLAPFINVGFANCIMDAANTSGSGAKALQIANSNTDGASIEARFVGCQLTVNNGNMITFSGAGRKQVAISSTEFFSRADSAVDTCISGLDATVFGTIVGNYVKGGVNASGTTPTQPQYFLDNGSIANLKVTTGQNDTAACSGGFQEP